MNRTHKNQTRLERALTSPLLREYSALTDELRRDVRWGFFEDKLHNMDRSVLYRSPLHGVGHIERVLLFGAFMARDNSLTLLDSELLSECCAYHDTGRVNDDVDHFHGFRSAQKLKELTGRDGEELKLIMAAVEAHSRGDGAMESVLRSYEPEDYSRAELLAECLKDADGLDRVRINDLDTRYLRRRTSPRYAPLARLLVKAYYAVGETI